MSGEGRGMVLGTNEGRSLYNLALLHIEEAKYVQSILSIFRLPSPYPHRLSAFRKSRATYGIGNDAPLRPNLNAAFREITVGRYLNVMIEFNKDITGSD